DLLNSGHWLASRLSHHGSVLFMKQNLRVSLGAVVLALATLAAVIFALLNFDQRNRYDQTYDGVTWIDTEQGVQARHVAPNSPASHTAIHSGDILVTFNGAPISRAAEVARWLERAGLWTLVHYKLSRNGQEFETPLVTAPAEKPLAAENYLRAVGLLFLFIGLFIFIRRWHAPRAVHFYIFCLASLSYGRSISAGSWTLSIGKSIGRKSRRACWSPLCSFISRWFFPGGPSRGC